MPLTATQASEVPQLEAVWEEALVKYLYKQGSASNAPLVIQEMLKYLAFRGTPAGCDYPPAEAPDEVWHAFQLLDSAYYQEWCLTHFGRVIHHITVESPNALVGNKTVADTYQAMVAAGYTPVQYFWLVGSDKKK